VLINNKESVKMQTKMVIHTVNETMLLLSWIC